MKAFFLLGLLCFTYFGGSAASSITCSTEKLQEKYLQRDSKCYGYKGAECTDSSECLSTAYECRSGICQESRNVTFKDVECSAKYDKTVCWVPGTVENRQYALEAFKFPLGPVEYVCRVNKNGVKVLGKLVKAFLHKNTCKYIWNGKADESSDYELLGDTGSRWKSDGYTMDKAVFGGFSEDGKPILICRAWLKKYFPKLHGKRAGRLSPPSYNTCKFVNKKTIHERSDFEVLVN